MSGSQPTRRTAAVPGGDTSMRVLEYAVGFIAVLAAVLLGSVR